MNTMNFNDLPSDIRLIIFEKNRKDNRDRILQEFWDEWEDYYWDDYEWEEMNISDKIKLYKGHLRAVEVHESIMCDGSLPDWCYEAGL